MSRVYAYGLEPTPIAQGDIAYDLLWTPEHNRSIRLLLVFSAAIDMSAFRVRLYSVDTVVCINSWSLCRGSELPNAVRWTLEYVRNYKISDTINMQPIASGHAALRKALN